MCRVLCFHSSGHKGLCLLGYSAIRSDESQPTFRSTASYLLRAGLLLGLFLDLENRGDFLLQNVGWLPMHYMAELLINKNDVTPRSSRSHCGDHSGRAVWGMKFLRSSKDWILGSNPTRGMDVCVCCSVCRQRPCGGLTTVHEVLPTVYRIKKPKKRPRSKRGL
jgi:hypothetical protein